MNTQEFYKAGIPLKSRAWDKVSEKMATIDAIDYLKGVVTLTTEHSYHYNLKLEDVVIMESLGLCSLNEKQVFEYDIASIDGHIGIVRKGKWFFYIEMINYKDVLSLDDIADENDNSIECYIVGDVFRNPELLCVK